VTYLWVYSFPLLLKAHTTFFPQDVQFYVAAISYIEKVDILRSHKGKPTYVKFIFKVGILALAYFKKRGARSAAHTY
jgi:hypothetical protein